MPDISAHYIDVTALLLLVLAVLLGYDLHHAAATSRQREQYELDRLRALERVETKRCPLCHGLGRVTLLEDTGVAPGEPV